MPPADALKQYRFGCMSAFWTPSPRRADAPETWPRTAGPTRVDHIVTRVQTVTAATVTPESAEGMVVRYTDTTIAEASGPLDTDVQRQRVRLTETAHALGTRALPLAAVRGEDRCCIRQTSGGR
ncbi:hypothetical protein [Streptomyces sp. MBT62]|uniref:hypothetical protein n=1 Tax=Streptomyces sp. MBT62 TaxID=2800410 RepID=UPI00190C86F6|nr:hypothetical protein [Streptomyces sp. MBT62]MBK3564848.1 hypothetical protein [Streptomyces sp. MBT62]